MRDGNGSASAIFSTSSIVDTMCTSSVSMTFLGMSARSFSLSRGRMIFVTPARCAASTFSLTPPIGRTFPRSVISPVMATSRRVGILVSADTSVVAIVMPADGPSAGITMATALLSAVTKIPVHRDMAMTGEITLRGKVLPVGGVKDKILAAARAGLTKIILPAENERDLEDIPADVREKMEFHLVESMDEVVNLALDGTIVPLSPKEKLTAPVEPPITH